MTIDGVLTMLLNTLAVSMGFTYKLIDPRRDKLYPRGEYYINDMIRLLEDKTADIALFNFIPTNERLQKVDFPGFFYVDNIRLLFGKSQNQVDINFVKTFSWQVWMFLCLSGLGCSSLYHCFTRFSRAEINLSKKSYFDVVWAFIGTLLNQGSNLNAQSIACRVLLSLWYLTSLLFVCCFSGLIISSIARRKHVTLDTILTSNYYEPLLLNGSIIHFYSTTNVADESLLRDLKRKVKPSKYKSYHIYSDEILDEAEFNKKVLLPMYSELRSALSGRYLRRKECSFLISRTRYYPTPLSIALGKHLPVCLREDIKARIEMMQQSLLIDQWLKNYTRYADNCLQTKESRLTSQPLTIQDLMVIYFGGVFGILVSLATLLGEIIWKKISMTYTQTSQ
ncbi:glutamate receptor ionotropic, kainate 2-like isoform X2 [Tachypleus tridentatus]